MKKRAWSPLVMWVMVIWLYGVLSIAASSKPNGTASLCDGSVEDCLLDSWLPTISSSHFRRVLADRSKYSSGKTLMMTKAVFRNSGKGYLGTGPDAVNNSPECRDPYSDRSCHQGGGVSS